MQGWNPVDTITSAVKFHFYCNFTLINNETSHTQRTHETIHSTCPPVPPGTNSWLANLATAVMAGRRSPQADARMSLTVTLVALSVTMVSAWSRRCSSSGGETTSSSSFLRSFMSFLLRRGRRRWCLFFHLLSNKMITHLILNILLLIFSLTLQWQTGPSTHIVVTCVRFCLLAPAPWWSPAAGEQGLWGSAGTAKPSCHICYWWPPPETSGSPGQEGIRRDQGLTQWHQHLTHLQNDDCHPTSLHF